MGRVSNSSTPHSWTTARMKGLSPARFLSCILLYNTVCPAHWLPGAIADSSSATGPSSILDKFESNTSNPVSDTGPQTLHCAFFFFQELRLPQLFGQRLKGLPYFTLQWLSRDHVSPTPTPALPLCSNNFVHHSFIEPWDQELQNPTLGSRRTESQGVTLY